jgi:hypothetical protein
MIIAQKKEYINRIEENNKILVMLGRNVCYNDNLVYWVSDIVVGRPRLIIGRIGFIIVILVSRGRVVIVAIG